MPRDGIHSEDELIRRAQIVEGMLARYTGYKPPPKPEESLIPEAAFERSTKNAQLSNVAVVTSTSVSRDSAQDLVAQGIEEKMLAYKKKKAKKAAKRKKGQYSRR